MPSSRTQRSGAGELVARARDALDRERHALLLEAGAQSAGAASGTSAATSASTSGSLTTRRVGQHQPDRDRRARAVAPEHVAAGDGDVEVGELRGDLLDDLVVGRAAAHERDELAARDAARRRRWRAGRCARARAASRCVAARARPRARAARSGPAGLRRARTGGRADRRRRLAEEAAEPSSWCSTNGVSTRAARWRLARSAASHPTPSSPGRCASRARRHRP